MCCKLFKLKLLCNFFNGRELKCSQFHMFTFQIFFIKASIYSFFYKIVVPSLEIHRGTLSEFDSCYENYDFFHIFEV